MSAWLATYRTLGSLALLLGAPYLLWRAFRRPAEMRERWGRHPQHRADLGDGARPVWIHAASLGEVEAVRAWLADAPFLAGVPWFLTVTSTSARRRAAERLGPHADVSFAPLDHDLAVGTFLKRRRPRALVLVETELWPVTLDRCRRAGLPVYVVSGRITARGFARMLRVVPLWRAVAPAVRAVAAQGAADAERYARLGFGPVAELGNLKYRVAASEALPDRLWPAGWEPETGAPLWVLGSLRMGEESVLPAVRAARERGVLVVLAPRHLRERRFWIEACRRAGLEPMLRSASPPAILAGRSELAAYLAPGVGGRPRLVLADTHGELREWYARAHAASIGGTWVPIGGHSLFEPLALGVPISYGPHVDNVADVAAAAEAEGAGRALADPGDLLAWVEEQVAAGRRQKTERSALLAARMVAGAGERTRTFLSEIQSSEAGGRVHPPRPGRPGQKPRDQFPSAQFAKWTGTFVVKVSSLFDPDSRA
jgi:3-deoxy-D-manno-octulosonic-acid transferase